MNYPEVEIQLVHLESRLINSFCFKSVAFFGRWGGGVKKGEWLIQEVNLS